MYYPYATLLADQIARAHPKRDFDICIMYNQDMPQCSLVKKHDLRKLRFEIPVDWSSLATDKKISLAAYQRIIAPTALQKDYRRILYLDSDIIYRRGDIGALLNADLGGHPVGAVLDNLQHRRPGRLLKEFKAAGLGHAKYFNSGVLLFDVASFVDQGIEAKAFEYAASDKRDLLWKHDQSALNCALHKNWAELAPVWNWPSFHRHFFFSHFADPCLVHFMSSRKPWRDKAGIYPTSYVKAYQSHLAAHFPDLAAQMPQRKKPVIEPLALDLLLSASHSRFSRHDALS
ncbi:MAG: hypothetical protein GY945_16555 [Rhodobacteraceae bacterium]|nr:hypothetical protein [Paracoccaceae bacterium]